jgi:hypothetical protein
VDEPHRGLSTVDYGDTTEHRLSLPSRFDTGGSGLAPASAANAIVSTEGGMGVVRPADLGGVNSILNGEGGVGNAAGGVEAGDGAPRGAMTDRLTRGATIRNPVLRAVRNLAFTTAGHIEPVTRRLAMDLSELATAPRDPHHRTESDLAGR